MSALHALTRNPVFRRLWLFAVGLLLAYGYWFGFIGDIGLTPGLLGVLIGMLSDRLISSIINILIVLFGYVFAILALAIAGNLGAGDPFVWDYYQALIAETFVDGAVPLLPMIIGLLAGQLLRYLFLRAMGKIKFKS